MLRALLIFFAAIAAMGGPTPGKVLGLTQKKKDGFPRVMVKDTTSGRTAVLDASMVVYDSFYKLTTDELRVQVVELFDAMTEGRPSVVHPPLQSAVDSTVRYWYDFLKTELEVDRVRAVFDGQHSISKREEKKTRDRKRQAAYEAAHKDGITQDEYRTHLLGACFSRGRYT